MLTALDLYYVDGKGNVCEAKMARGGKRKR